jgi:hypothetical protein
MILMIFDAEPPVYPQGSSFWAILGFLRKLVNLKKRPNHHEKALN